jgi:hypothetical protein
MTRRKIVCICAVLVACFIAGGILSRSNQYTPTLSENTHWLNSIVTETVTQPFYLYECDRFISRAINTNLRGLEVVVVGMRGRILIERTKYGETEFIEFYVYPEPLIEAELRRVESPFILYDNDFIVHHGSRIVIEDGVAFFIPIDDSGRTSGNNLTVIRTVLGVEQHIHFNVYPPLYNVEQQSV